MDATQVEINPFGETPDGRGTSLPSNTSLDAHMDRSWGLAVAIVVPSLHLCCTAEPHEPQGENVISL